MSFNVFRTLVQSGLIVLYVVVFIINVLVLCCIQLFARFIFYSSNPIKYQHLIDWTKKHFLIILTAIFKLAAPSAVRITTDTNTIPKGTFWLDNGRISSKLYQNIVVICNHQIYTDWVYLWWLAYVANMGGRVFIMLKKSLRSIPLLGYGMSNFRFLFMNRKWIHDRINLFNNLNELNANAQNCGPLNKMKPILTDNDGIIHWPDLTDKDKPIKNGWPYNFILFPEGTNLTANTRNKTEIYAKKVGKKTFKNVLLPRSTGLRFSLQTLRKTLDNLYDVTIAYSGVSSDSYSADNYSLRNMFLRAKYPKLVDIHIRAFKIDDIPLDNEEEFETWLYKVWEEKDQLLDEYYKTNSFNLDPNTCETVIDKFNVRYHELFFVYFISTALIFISYQLLKVFI